MTGDGVNDAPSLKKADTGIAVEGASDAARSAADIVFLAPGLGAIIDALKTSRQIFHRMYAYVVYRIALSLHMEIFLGLWIAILNRNLNIELIVFIGMSMSLTRGSGEIPANTLQLSSPILLLWPSPTTMPRTPRSPSSGTCQSCGV